MSEDPDWKPAAVHESLEPYMSALGVMHRNWIDTERFLEFLLWHYLGTDRDAGEAITTHIGNVTRAHILSSLAKIREANSDALSAVEHIVDCYDVLRTNRNYLAHSQMGGVDEDGVTTFRVTSRGSLLRESIPVPLSRVRSTTDQIYDFKMYVMRVRNHLQRGTPLPDKFPKPRDLLKLLRQDRDRNKPAPPPQSS